MKSSKSSTLNQVRYVGQSTVFRGLLRLFSCALIVLSVLCVQSCRTTKATAQTVQQTGQALTARQQSVISVEVAGATERPQADTAGLTLPLAAIKALPEGAEYSSKKGSVRVTVQRRGSDSVHVQADATTRLADPSVRVRADMDSQITALDSSNAQSVTAAGMHQQTGRQSGIWIPFLALSIIACGVFLLLFMRNK